MRIKRLLAGMIFAGLPALTYAQTLSYKDAIMVIAANVEAKIAQNDIVAVVSFQSATSQFTNRVMDDLINRLVNGNIRVVDRQNIEKIHAEQNYQLSGYVDDNFAVSIGHELGAAAIIIGTGENMTGYYRLSFRMLSVKTAEIIMQSAVNVKYDSTMTRLLNNHAYNSNEIGNTHFLVGARLGAGFEINTADEDMIGTGFTPNETSNSVFNAVLYGAFRFNDAWSVQPEINFMVNNGMKISGHDYDYTIQITDPINNKTWNDSVSLRFNKKQVTFKIAAQSKVQGIILAPTGRAYKFSGTNTSVVVPWSSKDYLVVFCGASANTETVYSLGIDVEPSTAVSGFTDTASYEPNDTEESASLINRQKEIMSYLHKGDFDYYRIRL